jgi:hypothetical protein
MISGAGIAVILLFVFVGLLAWFGYSNLTIISTRITNVDASHTTKYSEITSKIEMIDTYLYAKDTSYKTPTITAPVAGGSTTGTASGTGTAGGTGTASGTGGA